MKNIKKLINTIKFEDIFIKYNNKWNLIAKHKYLSTDFINIYFWKLKPFQIEKTQKLAPYIIHKYANALNWNLLIKCQNNIPQILIRQNIDKINWKYLAIWQNLSIQFIKQFKNFLKLQDLQKNIIFSQQKTEIIKKIFK